MRTFKILFLCCCLIVPMQSNAQLLRDLIKSIVSSKKTKKVQEQPKSETNATYYGNTRTQQASSDEVTLTVSADGATKDEAVKNALRSAIEQSYGVFVSANTSLLNDELVKDEIATVASGNIKNYRELTSSAVPGGKTFVTLSATVSVSKLISYAQSKGAQTEFAGATFGMNMRLKEMNKQNELKVLQNLVTQIKALLPFCYDRSLTIEDPKTMANGEDLLRLIGVRQYYNIEAFVEECSSYKKGNSKVIDKELYNALLQWINDASNCYFMEMKVQLKPNENKTKLRNLVTSTLRNVALSDEEVEEYRKLNLPYTFFSFPFCDYTIRVRNSGDDLEEMMNDLKQAIWKAHSDFKVVDNLGVSSYFDGYQLINSNGKSSIIYLETYDDCYRLFSGDKGLFSPFFLILSSKPGDHSEHIYDKGILDCDFSISEDDVTFWGPEGSMWFENGVNCLNWVKEWDIYFTLPKSDISKYTSFKVEKMY